MRIETTGGEDRGVCVNVGDCWLALTDVFVQSFHPCFPPKNWQAQPCRSPAKAKARARAQLPVVRSVLNLRNRFYAAMRIKTYLDNSHYLSSLWSDAELVIAGALAGF